MHGSACNVNRGDTSDSLCSRRSYAHPASSPIAHQNVKRASRRESALQREVSSLRSELAREREARERQDSALRLMWSEVSHCVSETTESALGRNLPRIDNDLARQREGGGAQSRPGDALNLRSFEYVVFWCIK